MKRIPGTRRLECGCRATGYGRGRVVTHYCARGQKLVDALRAFATFGMTPEQRLAYDNASADAQRHFDSAETYAVPWNSALGEPDMRAVSGGERHPRYTRCSKCQAGIVFLRTQVSSHPVDVDTVDVEDTIYNPGLGHRSHFDTCPNAADFRKGRPG